MHKWGWALLVFVFVASPTTVFSQPLNIYTFSGDVDLGVHYTAFVSSGQHYIGARGDTVYVVTSNGRVWCQKSTDGGRTFDLPVLIDLGYNPSMRVDTAGVVYVAYQDVYADIRFTKSTDGGITFTPRVKVNDDTLPQVGQERPSIAVNNKGYVFIVWADRRTNPFSTFSAVSYDGGATFAPNVQVNEPGTPGTYADVAATDDGWVYVTYGGFIVARSVDSGLSFTHRAIIADSSLVLGFNSITASGPLVGLFGEAIRFVGDSLETTLRFSASTDYGQTFSSSVRIDEDTTGDYKSTPLDASLSFNKNTFFVCWREHVIIAPDSQRVDIFFSYSSDTGKNFARNVRVNPESYRFHACPSLAVSDSGKVYVAWLDARNDPFYGEDYHTFVARGDPNFIKGDLNLDLLLSIADVVTLLNAVFLQQSFPAPFSNADANCDGFLGPADVVLLLNRVFLGTPLPC